VSVKKRSKILDTVYEAMKGLYAAGAIDQATMRDVTQACLPPSVRPRSDEMRREYKRSDFRKGFVRGKYAKKARLSPLIVDDCKPQAAVGRAVTPKSLTCSVAEPAQTTA